MFKGSFVALVTPHRDGRICEEKFRELIEFQIKKGTNGIVPCGCTGEAATMSHQEQKRVIDLTVEVVNGRVPVVAGAGSNYTEEAVDLSRHARKAGCDGVLSITPYYNKPTPEGLYRHYERIAREVDIPIMLYNVPSRTVTSLSVDTIVRLSQIDNIIGVKEASGNMDQVSHTISNARDGFLVWSGNDSDNFAIMALGGYGAISVAAHLVGKQIKEMIDKVVSGQIGEAAAIHRHLLPLVNVLFILSNPVPLKYALNQIGFKVGKPRLPLVEPDEKSAATIRETLKKFKTDLPVK